MRGNILLGWEFGAGLEHVRRLTEIAIALQGRGWNPIFAVRQLQSVTSDRRTAGFRVMQAPVAPSLVEGVSNFRTGTYGEIIAAFGLSRPPLLRAIVRAWDEILDHVQPKVVIADYSPFLCVAAHGLAPVIAIGDGFVLPPSDLPAFPVIHQNGTFPLEERKALADINALQDERGRPHLDALPQLAGTTSQIVCTYPELDVYRRVRKSRALGPLGLRTRRQPLPRRRKIFFYLAADFRWTWPLLDVLAGSGIPAHGYIRSAPAEKIAPLIARGLKIYPEPQPMERMLAESSAVVHHGGVGTSEIVLSAGRPQLVLPRHLEQTLNARCLMNIGSGVVLRVPFKPESALRAVEALVNVPRFTTAAQKAALRLAASPHGRSLNAILAHCEAAAGIEAAA